ncbi:HAD family hydrolase [Geodermatophilus sp. SYSU D01119]
MTPPGRPAVVSDLDGTLVAGDSFGGFLRHLLTRQPPRLAAALPTAPLWLPARATGRLRVPAERRLVRLARWASTPTGSPGRRGPSPVEHAGPAGGRTAAAAVARLREHVARGDRVVVPPPAPGRWRRRCAG